MNPNHYLRDLGETAKKASRAIASANTETKNTALVAMADELIKQKSAVLIANKKDVDNAKKNNLTDAFIDRLTLTELTVTNMAEGLIQISKLPDPVGEISVLTPQPSGIEVGKMRTPIGVIGIIYESRPNVTADAAGLCLKSGNAVILRGGSESFHSNKAIGMCITAGLKAARLPEGVVHVIDTTDREAVGQLITMSDYVDVIIPRGGKGLVERITNEAKIPVIKHLDGVCHVYVDEEADIEKALAIAENAKTQRYGTCNTMETLLVHEALAASFLPKIGERLSAKAVEIRCDEVGLNYINNAVCA